MKDKFTQNDDHEEVIDRALRSLSEEIDAPAVFKSELEQRLVTVHQARSTLSLSFFKQALPMLGWTMGLVMLALFLNWVIRGIVTTPPIPAALETKTPFGQETPSPIPTGESITAIPEEAGYDWRETKLYLAQSLPASPAEADVLLLKETQHATVETARALAQQFGIIGEVFEAPGTSPNTTDYVVTYGKQRLFVQSEIVFDYYADYNDFANLNGGKNITPEQARDVIDPFLRSHGLDFEYEVENGRQIPGLFYVIPLAENGFPIRFDYNLPNRLEFIINDAKQIMHVSSIRVDYDPVGRYGIITAEEALQKILGNSNASLAGVVESVRSGETLVADHWQRSYPENETITIYGQPIFYPSFDTARPGFFAIGQYTATGDTSGLENLDSMMIVEATGQFFTENGIKRFNIESWSVSTATPVSFLGILQRNDEYVILKTDTGNEYQLSDLPIEVPLETQLMVDGFIIKDDFVWTSIQHFDADMNRGGGGGGGVGFYKLNLSGTPVPFPSPTLEPEVQSASVEYIVKEGDTVLAIAQGYGVTVDEIVQANNWLSEEHALIPGKTLVIPGTGSSQSLIGQRVEGRRGTFTVSIYRMRDGNQRVEYVLSSMPNDGPFFFAILEGANLQDLQTYHNIPIDIWGTIDRIDPNGNLVVKVERYEIPFPDLRIQVLEGTQRTTEIDGQAVILFTTTDGTTYAQIMLNGEPDSSLLGVEGDPVILESLAIPGETFAGYPALRIFSGGMAVNPKNAQAAERIITADQPFILDEFPPDENIAYPTITIETVELVYYTSDPRYPKSDSNIDPMYIQPAWRFHGHYSNGDEIEFLVQALKQEYLLPEVLPHIPPG